MNSKRRRRFALTSSFFAAVFCVACSPDSTKSAPASAPAPRPSILLVTLDTTRADSIGPDAIGVATPSFNALVARGRRFRQAYATVPETLPAHASLMTGLYPAGHGIHENGRSIAADRSVLAERLQKAGYRTAAFVSSFVLAKRFGLARGFDVYDDGVDARTNERAARETTMRAMEFLRQTSTQPTFLWVHYYDAHAPYAPPEPYRSKYAMNPYLGEIAAVDEQLGLLIDAFEKNVVKPVAQIVVADHGEALGDHGESQHGLLVYQSTMHVPLVIAGPGVAASVVDTPVSARRVFQTALDWAGVSAEKSLRATDGVPEIVLGEGMKPFLEYGWQPQTIAVDGALKAIRSDRVELYDVFADPLEANDLAASRTATRAQRTAIQDYPTPSIAAAVLAAPPSDEDRRKLASLGYVSASTPPVVRKDAPRPADMTSLFDSLERASTLFVREEYAAAIPLLQSIAAKDPTNLDAVLRLGIAQSSLGHAQDAARAFEKARNLAPDSDDVRLYFALHQARGPEWADSAPTLERIVASDPNRVAAIEGLAAIRVRQNRLQDALALKRKLASLREPTDREWLEIGRIAMEVEDTNAAIDAFENARRTMGESFRANLELGVLYLASRRFENARDALDRVSPRHPAYPMALFKRAQVSVLLNEPDRDARIEAARRHANAATRELIERERLFKYAPR